MLFADSIVLLSEIVTGSQTQLTSLYRAASRLELRVNKDKSSSIAVFRKVGYLSLREKWVYGRRKLEISDWAVILWNTVVPPPPPASFTVTAWPKQ